MAQETGKATTAPGTGTTFRLLPLFRSFAGYPAGSLPADILAGLTLAAIAIPEQMATAELGGFAPQIGFLAFLAGSIAFAVLGANRFLSCGADSTITPILAGGLSMMAVMGSAQYQQLAVVLALLVGVMLVIAAALRLGAIANLLSVPVMLGFLAGISLHIIVSQLPHVLGLAAVGGSTLSRLATLIGDIDRANPRTMLIGAGVLGSVVLCEKLSPKIPGALIGLVGATVVVIAAGLESQGVAVLGTIPHTMPMPELPMLAFRDWLKLVPLAFVIAIIVMVQTAATTRSFPSDPLQPPDIDRDFLGVGGGSLLSGLFGGFAVNASPPRTGVVAESGGQSQIAGLAAAAIVLALLLFGTGLLRHVPEAALGGILLFVALRILRLKQILAVSRQSFSEFLLIPVTAALIIVLPIEQGAFVGIILSLLHGIWSTAHASVVPFDRVPGTTIWWPAHPHIAGECVADVTVVGLQAPLSFLNAARFRAEMTTLLATAKPRLLVLEAGGIVSIDFTAAGVLREFLTECAAKGITVAVARLESLQTQNAFHRFRLFEVLSPHHVFHSVEEAVRSLRPPQQENDPRENHAPVNPLPRETGPT
ncbi:MAG: SulP family inorganic anion transporter [Alphaproteobacteria bacterium]|nr:SulP family inorganic anion transporter [Alphaproteobacteria bacterium]